MQARGFSEALGLEDAAELDDTAYDQAGASPTAHNQLSYVCLSTSAPHAVFVYAVH